MAERAGEVKNVFADRRLENYTDGVFQEIDKCIFSVH
jgi:hypothetical protein